MAEITSLSPDRDSGLALPAPTVSPPLDPAFRPAALANRAYRELVSASAEAREIVIALEQADGLVFHHPAAILPTNHPASGANLRYVERLTKFLLWSRGGCRVHLDAPPELVEALAGHYESEPAGRFDAAIMGDRIYERPFHVIDARREGLPPETALARPLGRHLDGCRIGFDLGASDRKVAAVIDGNVVFSEETVWDPVGRTDPQWHFEQIMAGLRSAATHMPRVDAIGGSAAGVYVNNRVKVASLFRGVPQDLFDSRVRDLFLEIRSAWNNIPFELANDGEVTALAGSMSIGDNCVLGIAMGSSEAGGYVDSSGGIASWLNELAFAPIDYNPAAPLDEWSGDRGCGVQYLSQQAVARLIPAAGIDVDPGLHAAEKLKRVQALMDQGDERCTAIYRTLGTYLGYALAHYADFYDVRHVLVLGRVTSGTGGQTIVEQASAVLAADFPDLSERIRFHMPDEKDKRHGQAIAAASLPMIAADGQDPGR